MKFTVVIPTFKRADLLRIALQSVSLQTAKHLISKVIVSENGLDDNSMSVCNEFSDLPIHYVYQQKQLTVQKHMQWIMSQEQNNYVALLCDDDWWDIHHIALAAESLAKDESCIAYFSNFAYVESPHSLKRQTYYNGVEILHIGSLNFSNYKPTIYEKENIFLFSFLITPFHFSAMVCKGDVLAKSVVIFDDMHPTYADRLLYPAISIFGDIIFNPLKTAMILYHQNMDSHNYDAVEWNGERKNGSLKLMEMAKANNIDLKSMINDAYDSSVDDDKDFIVKQISGTFPERKDISWFRGIDLILSNDNDKLVSSQDKRTLKRKLASRVANSIRRFL